MGSADATDANIACGLIILTLSLLVWVGVLIAQRADELRVRADAVSSGDTRESDILYCGYSNSLYDDGLSSDKIQNFFLGAHHRTASPVLPDVDSYAPISSSSECTLGDQCVICLEKLNTQVNVRIPRVCGHAMHARCADLWLIDTARNSCPTCMASVVPTRDASMRLMRQAATTVSD